MNLFVIGKTVLLERGVGAFREVESQVEMHGFLVPFEVANAGKAVFTLHSWETLLLWGHEMLLGRCRTC